MNEKRIEEQPDKARHLTIQAEPGKTADALLAEAAL